MAFAGRMTWLKNCNCVIFCWVGLNFKANKPVQLAYATTSMYVIGSCMAHALFWQITTDKNTNEIQTMKLEHSGHVTRFATAAAAEAIKKNSSRTHRYHIMQCGCGYDIMILLLYLTNLFIPFPLLHSKPTKKKKERTQNATLHFTAHRQCAISLFPMHYCESNRRCCSYFRPFQTKGDFLTLLGSAFLAILFKHLVKIGFSLWFLFTYENLFTHSANSLIFIKASSFSDEWWNLFPFQIISMRWKVLMNKLD